MGTVYQKIIDHSINAMALNLTKFAVKMGLDRGVYLMENEPQEVEELMRIEDPLSYQHQQEIKRFIEMLKSMENGTDMKVLLRFKDLVGLSQVLTVIPLKNKERVDILLKFIEINIKNIEEYNKGLREYDLLLSQLSKESTSPLRHLLPYLSMDLNVMGQDELIEVKQKNDILKEHYFNKLDSYDHEDIEIFINVLINEGFNEDICNIMKSILLKNMTKRNTYNYVTPVQGENKENNSKLSDKEYKRICYEINKYFNLTEMKSIRILSLEEITACTSLLIELGLTEDKIANILKIIEKNNKNSNQNPIAQYNGMYEKLKYYGSSEHFLEYIGEIFIVNDEDYQFWKDTVKQELEIVITGLPKTYEFEIERAKKLIK